MKATMLKYLTILTSVLVLPVSMNSQTEKYVITTTEGVIVSNGEVTLAFDPILVTEVWKGEGIGLFFGRRFLVFQYTATSGEVDGYWVHSTWLDESGSELSFPTSSYKASDSKGWFSSIIDPAEFDGISVVVELSRGGLPFPPILVELTPSNDTSPDHTIEYPRDQVMSVQKILKELGYSPGPIDGYWGSKTEEALKKYQNDRNIPVTGRLDAVTLKTIGV